MPRAHVSALLTFLERLDLRIERAVLLVDLVDLGLDFLQLVAGWSFFLRTRQHAHTRCTHVHVPLRQRTLLQLLGCGDDFVDHVDWRVTTSLRLAAQPEREWCSVVECKFLRQHGAPASTHKRHPAPQVGRRHSHCALDKRTTNNRCTRNSRRSNHHPPQRTRRSQTAIAREMRRVVARSERRATEANTRAQEHKTGVTHRTRSGLPPFST